MCQKISRVKLTMRPYIDYIFRWTLLQGYNAREETPSGWVVRMFREANVPWQDIWEATMGVRGGEVRRARGERAKPRANSAFFAGPLWRAERNAVH